MRLTTLSPRDAYSYFEHCYHIRQMSSREIQSRTNNSTNNINGMLKFYKKRLHNATVSDQQTLQQYIEMLTPYINKFSPTLSTVQVKVAIVSAGTEWDYPFTLAKQTNSADSIIVFSEVVLATARQALYKHNDQGVREFLTILLHEIIHLDQKARPTIYNYVNRFMGFQLLQVNLPEQVKQTIITNPDGSHKEGSWVMPFRLANGLVYFMPCLSLTNNDNKQPVLIQLEQHPLTGNLSVNNTQPVPIASFPLYLNLFGMSAGKLTHPHEITAYMLSEYIISGHNYTNFKRDKLEYILQLLQ